MPRKSHFPHVVTDWLTDKANYRVGSLLENLKLPVSLPGKIQPFVSLPRHSSPSVLLTPPHILHLQFPWFRACSPSLGVQKVLPQGRNLNMLVKKKKNILFLKINLKKLTLMIIIRRYNLFPCDLILFKKINILNPFPA